MIALKYSKSILNALFNLDNSAAIATEAENERAALLASGVRWGADPALYCYYYVQDGYVTTGEGTAELNASKNAINASTYWRTSSVSESLEYENAQGTTSTRTFTGWTVVRSQYFYYPSNAYLALFTTMPDERGSGYAEPADTTTYMRVDLNAGILTGRRSMADAAKDDVTGAATITNKELIVYPEVQGLDWGTIVGIGVFQEETPGTGRPVFWGRVKPAVTATTEHVPLFRVGDLKVTLS